MTLSCELFSTGDGISRPENIRRAPPSADEWWEVAECNSEDCDECGQECSYAEDDTILPVGSCETAITVTPIKRFHNCGLETWERARGEWKRRTVDTLPERPTPAEYNHLVRGLTRNISQRTYELPQRMALSDLIEVYNDIWDGDRS